MTQTLARGSYRERNATADRALDILLLFSDERPALSGAEVALHLGVARSTAYRLQPDPLPRQPGEAEAVRLTYERGHILPVNAGASALALLAWEGREDISSVLGHRQLTKLTRRTLTDPDELMARLGRIRARGVAVTREELDEDIGGVAAPVFGTDGVVRAAVGVAAPVSRLTAGRAGEVERRVRSAAAEIAERLASLVPG